MIPEHIRFRALDRALNLLGADIVEVPPASNSGFMIELMQRMFGGKAGWAWCMYAMQFVYWGAYKDYFGMFGNSPFLQYNDDGSIDTDAPNGHCYSVLQHCYNEPRVKVVPDPIIKSGDFIIPPGAIYIRHNNDKTGHTGMVTFHKPHEDTKKAIVHTIEGNSENMVKRHEYTLDYLINKNLKGVIF